MDLRNVRPAAKRSRSPEGEKKVPVGAMVSTVLGLRALMLAFTFAKVSVPLVDLDRPVVYVNDV
ncbi:MAG: hypothetical protein ABI537_00780 [Casimicrobiaceae bacterium]